MPGIAARVKISRVPCATKLERGSAGLSPRQNRLHETGFRLRVRLAVIPIFRRQRELQLRIGVASRIVTSEPVAKHEPLAPERAFERNEVQVMRALELARFAEPVHDVGLV